MKTLFALAILAIASIPCRAQIPVRSTQHAADKAWWLLNGASIGMTVADIENTQFCLRSKHCQEGNPIYFSRHPSRLRMYGINAILLIPETYYSYKWKREDDADRAAGRELAKYRWYVIPVINVISHGAGLTITLMATGR